MLADLPIIIIIHIYQQNLSEYNEHAYKLGYMFIKDIHATSAGQYIENLVISR